VLIFSGEVQMTRAEDILPVLDEWAFKFYREMDYRKEAAMIGRFQKDLESLEGIVIPRAYSTYTTRRVLCTQWMEGEKLSESRAEDVKELCTTLLNAYLIQLLDTGLLHADPHPGNLIRTPEGKICILDFGADTNTSPPCYVLCIVESCNFSGKLSTRFP
jgi:aarF domain-containing kinase